MVCPRALSWEESYSRLCTTLLIKIIQNHPGISFHFYADDTGLYFYFAHNNVAQAFDWKIVYMMQRSGFL